MDVLRRIDEALPVRGVLNALTWPRPLAYTAVMTVLDNLHRKGYADRALQRRAYFYRAAVGRGEAAAAAIRELLNEVVDPEAVLLHFARTASDDESKALQSGLNKRKPRG